MSALAHREEIERMYRYLSNANREIGILRAFVTKVDAKFRHASFDPEDFDALAHEARRILDHTRDGR